MVLLSVPVATWDMLPNDPAVNFVGFVRSDNLSQNAPLKRLLGERAPVDRTQTLPTSGYLSPYPPSGEEGMHLKEISSWHSQHPVEPERPVQHNLDSFQTPRISDDGGWFDDPTGNLLFACITSHWGH